MKTNKTWKRVLSFALMVGIVVSLLVPAVSALEVGDTLTHYFYDSSAGVAKVSGETVSIGSSTGTAKYLFSLNDNPVTEGKNSLNMTANQAGEWYAITINVPDAGLYDVAYVARNNGSGTTGDVFILPCSYADKSKADIDSAIKVATPLISNVSYTVAKTYNLQKVPFAEAGDYVVVFTATGVGTIAPRRLDITLKEELAPVATVGDTNYTDADEAIAAIAAADANTKVEITGKLQLSADLSTAAAITVNEGAELDLNGKKLTADVTGQGKLTDSSAAAGVVISDKAPTCGINADELLLKTTAGYQIFDYALTAAEPVKAEDGKSVSFWFDVRFEETAAYTAIAAGNSGFGLTVDLSWQDGSALPVGFGDGKSVENWADLMQQDPNYSFYICVQGLDSVTTAGTLKAAPKIVGLQGSSATEMTYDITVQ